MNWKQAFAVGVISPGVLRKEPVAYLYNGVRLPKLPEWDRETYPYAFIGKDNVNESFNFYVSDNPFKLDSNIYTCAQYYMLTNGEWVAVGSARFWTELMLPNIIWSNHDIISADGKTVLVSASDPIPVYE